MVLVNVKDQLTNNFIAQHEREQMEHQLAAARDLLDKRVCPGAEYTGWIDLPETFSEDTIERIEATAERIRRDFDVLIVVGIGGSYLGARAVIEALSHHFSSLLPDEKRGCPLVLYAGHQLSADYLFDLLEVVKGKRVALNVISKSGTTTESAIAFRVLRDHLFRYASREELAQRIVITTDEKRGALRRYADEMGITTFVIPDDIGGRYSVLTPVGLLPIAVAGLDIRQLLEGARRERKSSIAPLSEGLSAADRYAVNRLLLMRKGYKAEILACYEPSMRYFAEWWKQLFAESEGKDGKGLITMSVDFTSDLHSLGQLIQEGPRVFFETVIEFKNVRNDIAIPSDPSDLDQLEYLAGKPMSFVNRQARRGTALAHVSGGVPNMCIELKDRSLHSLGALIYFFERACALSGIMNGINPFDQPGVEAYKRNMFALLGKPGFEALREQLLRTSAEEGD
ncbi:MAG TPA: glucose-6-phosphate isomerase [Clostridiaceae bacterium]|nr:glucose-6-phosphate isomerase [Clostridiaceae bacterium]